MALTRAGKGARHTDTRVSTWVAVSVPDGARGRRAKQTATGYPVAVEGRRATGGRMPVAVSARRSVGAFRHHNPPAPAPPADPAPHSRALGIWRGGSADAAARRW